MALIQLSPQPVSHTPWLPKVFAQHVSTMFNLTKVALSSDHEQAGDICIQLNQPCPGSIDTRQSMNASHD